MHSIAKKVADQASKKPTLSKSEFGSLLIASLKSRRGSRVALSKKQISKKVTRPPSKVTRKGVRSRKLVRGKSARKPLHKRSGKKSEPSTAICPELNDKNPKEETAKRKFKRRRIGGRRRNNVELDEPSRLQRRTRYLMIKMKMEQNLIDAYSGEGWKGQSREKIRPEKELLRAKKQILKCKLGIRDAIHQLDLLSAVGCIEDSVMAPDGSVSHEHIFCAKCKSNDVVPDNDIILCDGTCNCAFHQMCLEPPLHTENSNLSIVVYLPPGDQGWFCKFCECRMEIMDSMNAHLGTQYSTSCEWQDLFEEEAAAPDGGNILILEEEWPSDDTEDENYDPERRENSMNGAGTDNDESDIASSSTSLGWSSDDEAVSGSRRWDVEGKEFRNQSIYSSLDSDESSDVEIMSGRRKRRAVDYRKLYDEMFGKDAPVADQLSEDEDWGPSKRKKKEKESDAASTLMTLYKRKKQAKKDETLEGKKDLPKESRVRRALSRIPPSAVEKLRRVFEENELPCGTVKHKLSEELGLEPGKVSKWFKNARYLALRSRKCSDFNPKLSGEATENENKSGGAEVSDAVTEVGVQTKRTSKDVFAKKKLRSNCGLKENDPKEVSLESQAGNSEMEAQKGDDPSLKTLLEEKSSAGKKHSYSKYSESPSHQLAESEMDRLCRAKDTLENMRQFLGSLPISKRRRSKALVLRERVVYVPTAELKEKITTVG
ncbi:unnamed protein product [Linum tenue]|uniref:Pathogenesis-related homeodomain protein n=1 Tax=Linum tenue TaxID=586396 RepID=A0AAV0S839_9ROSI|nr:unnamed protein product [Linum tenue]